MDLNILINKAFHLYYAKKYQESLAQCLEIMGINEKVFTVLYLQGLCNLHLNESELGMEKITLACSCLPLIRQLDFTTNHLFPDEDVWDTKLWERRLEEYLKHQLIENYLISFPKCGRTWVRFVLGNYALQGREGDALEVVLTTSETPFFATTEISGDDFPMLKSPGMLNPDKAAYSEKKVLFLIRDPRDVVVSLFFHLTHRNKTVASDQLTFDGNISEFIRQDVGSLKTLVEFYNIWMKNEHIPKEFKFITYEKLLSEPELGFREIIEFFNWPSLHYPSVKEAVEAGKFENMRQMEARGDFSNFRAETPSVADGEAFKVRRGVAGGFREYLNREDLNFVEEYLQRNLNNHLSFYKYNSTIE